MKFSYQNSLSRLNSFDIFLWYHHYINHVEKQLLRKKPTFDTQYNTILSKLNNFCDISRESALLRHIYLMCPSRATCASCMSMFAYPKISQHTSFDGVRPYSVQEMIRTRFDDYVSQLRLCLYMVLNVYSVEY